MPTGQPISVKQGLGYVFTHNPLYLVSAWLVLHGIGKAFEGEVGQAGGLLMTQFLCVYAMVLAFSSWIVVRFGKAWEDARTILLALLLVFAGISVSYDNLCLRDPNSGATNLLIGFGFCCAISEWILYALKIKLPMRYRIPFYLQLAVLFAFPAWLGRLSFDGKDPQMGLGVLLFPIAAGASLLTLLPAAHGSPQQDRNNGTPWSWPWYPWSIFALIAIAFGFRAWMLSISFSSAIYADPGFQAYFLCPILIASLFVLFEIGLRVDSKRVQLGSLVAMLFVVGLAFPGKHLNAAQHKLMFVLEQTLASPPILIATAVAAIAIFAMLRKAYGSEGVVVVAIAFASCLDVETRSISSLGLPHPTVLLALAGWQLAVGIWTKTTLRLVVGGIATLVLMGQNGAENWLGESSPYILGSIGVFWCALLPLFCRDALAKWLRSTGAIWIATAATCQFTAGYAISIWQPPWLPAAMVSSLAVVGLIYWTAYKLHWCVLASIWSAGLAVVLWSSILLDLFEDAQLRHGLAWYALGYGVLAAALLVSFWKAGLIQRTWLKLRHHE